MLAKGTLPFANGVEVSKNVGAAMATDASPEIYGIRPFIRRAVPGMIYFLKRELDGRM